MPSMLQQIENDPKFQEMGYEEQIEARAKAFSYDVQNNAPQEFRKLSPDNQEKLFQEAVMKPPKFENPQLDQKMQQIGKGIINGNQDAVDFAKKEVQLGVLGKSSLIANAVDRFLISPFMENLEAQGVQPDQVDHPDILKDPQRRKAIQYMDMMLNQNDKVAKNLQAKKAAIGIGSTLAEFTGLTLAGAGTVRAPKALGKIFTSGAMKALDPAVSTVRTAKGFAWQGMRLGVQHAAATASIGAAWENVQYALNKSANENPTAMDMMQKNARWLGGYFLGDIAFNAITDVALPMTKSFKKSFTGWEDMTKQVIKANRVDFERIQKDLVEGKGMDPVDWARMDKAQRSAYQRWEETYKTLRRVDQLDELGAMRLAGGQYGFTIEDVGDGSYKVFGKNNQMISHEANLAKVNERLKTEVSKVENQYTDALGEKIDFEESGRIAGEKGQIIARRFIYGQLEGMPEDSTTILSQAVAPKGGGFEPQQLEAFGKLYLRSNGRSKDLEKTVKAFKEGDNYKLQVKNETLAEIPAGKLSPTQEEQSVKKLFEGMEKYKGQSFPELGDISDQLKNIQRSQRIVTPNFVDHLARNSKIQQPLEKTSKGTWKIGQREFTDLKDAGDYAANQSMDFSDVANHLKINYGLELRRSKDGFITVKDRGENVGQAPSIAALLDENPQWRPKLPSHLGPEFSIVDGEVALRWQQRVVSGEYQQIAKFFDQFEKMDMSKKMKVGKDKTLKMDQATKQVEIEIPEIAHRQTFNSMGEAQQFLKGWRSFDKMEIIANRKGYRMTRGPGRWLFHTIDGKTRIARNKNEIGQVLKNAPVPDWAPEMTGLKMEMFQTEKAPTMNGWQRVWTGTGNTEDPNYSFKTHFNEWWKPFRSHMEALRKEGGDPDAIKAIDETMHMQDVMGGQIAEWERLFQPMFAKSSGRMIGKKRRRTVLQYLQEEARDPEEAKKFARETEMTSDELESARKIKTFLGENEEAGLARTFGVTPREFLFHYLPSFKEASEQGGKKVRMPDGSMEKFVDVSTLSVKDATNAKAFFKYARTSEVQQMALEEDPLRMIRSYLHQGMKNKYLKPTVEKHFNNLQAKGLHKEKIGQEYYSYVSTLYGFPQSYSEKQLRDMTQAIWRDMGLKGKAPQDISRMVMSWGYTAALGIRPALVMRNAMQIWMTLAPLVGNKRVAEATQQVLNNTTPGYKWVDKAIGKEAFDEGMFRNLRKKDVVKGGAPVFGGEMYSPQSFTYKALSMYSNSDDFTRAVAFTSAKNKFDWGLERFVASGKQGRKQLSQKEFNSLVGMNRMDDSVKEEITQKMAQGRYEEAGDIYAKTMTHETMFNYGKGAGPKHFRGGAGKIFGMFGTFPTFFVDHLRKSLKYSDRGEKAAFTARWLGNSAAIYGVFNMAGAEMNDFKPWNPLVFTGGPYYELFNKTLAAAGGDKQELSNLTGIRHKDGDVTWMPARSELLQWSIPFSMAAKDLAEGVQYVSEGYPYRGFLNATGFPLTEEFDVDL